MRQNLRPNRIHLGPKSLGTIEYRRPGMPFDKDSRDDELNIIKSGQIYRFAFQ